MKCKILLVGFITNAIIMISISCYAQYQRVTVTNGVEVFNKNTVTNIAGGPPGFTTNYHCGYGPYHIGWVGFLFTMPLSYTFNFTLPVNHVRIDVGDIVATTSALSVAVNNIPYPLTNANLSNSQSVCNFTQAIVANGELRSPPSHTLNIPFMSDYDAGLLTIRDPAGITSVTITYTGSLNPYGLCGVLCSFYFGQINTGNSGPACLGSTVQLNGDSTITESGNFFWTGPNGFTSTQQHPAITNLSSADTGIYTLRYISGIDTLTDTTHVRLLPGPDQPSVTANATSICRGETLQLVATSSTGASFQWRGPYNLDKNTAFIAVPNIQRYHAGRYIVTASEYTCSLSDTIDITVNIPVKNTVTHVACMHDGYNFIGRQLTESGIYIDTLTAATGCDSIVRLELAILPDPQVAIIVQRDIVANPCLGDVISLAAEGASNYNWYHNEQHVGNTDAIQVTLTESANRFILTGTDANACKDTVYASMPADGCCMVSLPDAFTPNGDSKNDRFGAIPAANTRVNNYRLEVFNRLGQQVYISNSLTDKWDGTNNGLPAGMGVYFYILSYECYDGGNIKKKGDVTLLR